MARPLPGDYAPYTIAYINLVEGDELLSAIENHSTELTRFFDELPDQLATFRYAPGKWSLKEVLQHIIDAERVFAYRAVAFARKEQAQLPGFDENEYAANSGADEREWHDLLAEFKVVRSSNDLLYKSFTSNTLQQTGIANGIAVTVNALGYITLGHALHHCKIIRERYLQP